VGAKGLKFIKTARVNHRWWNAPCSSPEKLMTDMCEIGEGQEWSDSDPSKSMRDPCKVV